MNEHSSKMLTVAAWLQAAYYIPFSLWAIVHIESFMAVTGPKIDIWLVKTVALLLTATGIVCAVAAKRKSVSFEVFLLAVLNCIALIIIDVYYPSIGRISPIYYLDALGNAILIAIWVFAWKNRHH
jgi:hypothetical protein